MHSCAQTSLCRSINSKVRTRQFTRALNTLRSDVVPGRGPGRAEPQNTAVDRAFRHVGARQIAEAHQEFAGDLAAGEAEGAAEQADPLGLVARVVRRDPPGEGAVRPAQRL